ncbi:hypothetical protein [Saccharopolyspora hattusasensis]|uniref:phage terminase small subunit n=1 Tax=Saccharopolyspora hattusasensis TaxID=1128679 RepID=UPI003D9729AD
MTPCSAKPSSDQCPGAASLTSAQHCPANPTSRPKRGPKTIKQWATLTHEHDVTAPELPERHIPWDARTVQSRQDLWASPMATQYDYTDRHRLFMLADLVDSYWRVDGVRDKIALAAGSAFRDNASDCPHWTDSGCDRS